MAEFRRLISYLYEYEGKVKGKNVGFVKLETRNGLCKLNVSVKKIYLGSGTLGVYLLSARREIFVGNLFLRNGSGEFRTVVQAADIEQSGETMEDCYGLTMYEKAGAWKVYTTIWEDSAAQAAEVAAPVLEEVVAGNHSGNAVEGEFAGNTESRLGGEKERETYAVHRAERIERAGDKAEHVEQQGDHRAKGEEQAGDNQVKSAEQAEAEDNRVKSAEQAGDNRVKSAEQAEDNRTKNPVQTKNQVKGAEQGRGKETIEMIGRTEGTAESTVQAGHEAKSTGSTGYLAENKESVRYLAENEESDEDLAEHKKSAGYLAENEEFTGYPAKSRESAKHRTESAESAEYGTEKEKTAAEDVNDRKMKEAERVSEKVIREEPKNITNTTEFPGEKKETSAREYRNHHVQPLAMNRNMRNRMNTANNNNSLSPRRPQGQLFFNMRPQAASSSPGAALFSRPQPSVPGASVSHPQPSVPGASVSHPQPSVPGASVSHSQPSVPEASVSRPQPSPSAVAFPRGQEFAPSETSAMQTPRTQQFAPAGPGTVPFSSSQQSMPEAQQMSEMHQPAENRQPFIRQHKEEPLIIGDPEALAKLEEEEKTAPVPLWDFLSKTYPKIQAFECQYGCEILVIKPQDIGLLPREVWVYGNNSFLLHGYYNYRYLILARLENPYGAPRYLLGVPGHYYSNEKYMASMFGFPNFVLSKNQQEQDGRFGYWYTDVRLGEGNVASALVRHVQKP